VVSNAKIMKAYKYFELLVRRLVFKSRFLRDIKNILPSNLFDLVSYSFNPKLTKQDATLGKVIEGFRSEVAHAYRDTDVETFASPHSGTSLTDAAGNVVVGDAVLSKNAGFARTGTKVLAGVQLKKVAEALRARRILELGTNTGLSGCYFLSSCYRPYLHSVEGSGELCQIARNNLKKISSRFEVVNAFFDEELAKLQSEGATFDLAFIDGQHEEQATIHYAEAIKPMIADGGAILFDDIFWSEGMYRAWCSARDDNDYAITLELGGRGLCVLPSCANSDLKVELILSNYLGKPLLTRSGW
jgi:protein-L-isoaspartate O-methyltransferase